MCCDLCLVVWLPSDFNTKSAPSIRVLHWVADWSVFWCHEMIVYRIIYEGFDLVGHFVLATQGLLQF